MLMRLATGTLTLVLVLGLVVSSTASLCWFHGSTGRLTADAPTNGQPAHDHGHSHSHASAHPHQDSAHASEATSRAESPDDLICHHNGPHPDVATTVELPNSQLMVDPAPERNPTLDAVSAIRHVDQAARSPLDVSPPDRPPARSA